MKRAIQAHIAKLITRVAIATLNETMRAIVAKNMMSKEHTGLLGITHVCPLISHELLKRNELELTENAPENLSEMVAQTFSTVALVDPVVTEAQKDCATAIADRTIGIMISQGWIRSTKPNLTVLHPDRQDVSRE